MFAQVGQGKKRRKNTSVTSEPSKESTENDEERNSGNKRADTRKQAAVIHQLAQAILNKGVNGIRAEFLANKRINDLTKMTVFQKNPTKNRYKDVGCLDDTRVILQEECDYIHANYVSSHNNTKRFICCQAPLDSTIPDHWKMIVQEKVEVILMLCNLTEKGSKKCAEYFPTCDPGKDTKAVGNFTLKAVKTKKVDLKCNTPAVINLTVIAVECGGKVVHSVDHYHWVDWPDRGVPPADLAPIKLLKSVMGTQYPVIVHCSAGIGRTGSIVLIQNVLDHISSGTPCGSMEDMLKKLRTQRANSVQTDQQYLYVHQVLLNFFHKEGHLDKSVVPFLDGFSKDYKKIVITG